MEPTQPVINPNLDEIVIKKLLNSYTNKLLAVFVPIMLLITLSTGVVIYFWQKSVTKELEQKITFQNEQFSTIETTKTINHPNIASIGSPTPMTNIPTDWNSYNDTVNNFSLRYPSSWEVVKGNEHATSIPTDMTEIIKLQSTASTIDISIIPWHNSLKKDLQEELSSFISSYFGDWDVSYENTQMDGEPALRGSYIQSAMGSQTKVVFTAVEKDAYVFFFQTQFNIETPYRLDIYDKVLSTFQFEN